MKIENEIMPKILTLKQLAEYVLHERGNGKTVIHAHGCFDLLHPGHIRHLKAAKSHGDILVVTVTPDRFVTKGPARPVFSEDLRVETLSAIEFVDAVALNKWADAANTIRFLKPNVYIKGAEYSNRNDDITGKIVDEKNAVEQGGGSLEFTNEVTFSSTSILNSHFKTFSDPAEKYLRELSQKYPAKDIVSLFDRMKDWKVTVIGDTIIDEYCLVRPMGRVEKAPIVACRYIESELFAGGILAIANHIANFVKQVDLVTVIGNDNIFSKISTGLKSNINLHLYKRDNGPTTLKRRYVNRTDSKKMFALEFIDDTFIGPQTETAMLKALPDISEDSDLTVVADFGHGTITPGIIQKLPSCSNFLAVNAQTNSSNFAFNPITKYPQADFISIDENEIRIATTSRFESIEKMLGELRKSIDCSKINITLAAKGSHFSSSEGDFYAPALTTDIVDTVGAGDAVLSVLSLCTAAGMPDEIIPFIGNCAGAIASNIVCNKSSIEKADLLKMIKGCLNWI